MSVMKWIRLILRIQILPIVKVHDAKEGIKFYSGGELFHKYLIVRVQYAKVLAALAAASLTTQTLKRSASVGEVQQLKTSPRGDP